MINGQTTTMNKTSAKFQNDQPKILGGVALTKYPCSAFEMPKNHKVYKLKKRREKLNDNVHEQNICKV